MSNIRFIFAAVETHTTMIEVQVNLPIAPEEENRWAMAWGEEPCVFSLETVRRIFDENPDEKEFKFNFNCDGGYVDEGLAIYDLIRTSGKTIYCNIESGCHSMAVVMLLAAPKENRTANPNCRALIHNVRGEFWDGMTAKELEDAAEDMRQEEQAILNIYADRTGEQLDDLQAWMDEEKVRNATWLLEHGFIGKINQYNTNLRKRRKSNNSNNPNKKTMAKKTKEQVLNEANGLMTRLKNLLGVATNYNHTDADGNVLFSTELEDDHLEVGINATPDGTFTLVADTSEYKAGTVVVIADGKITEINAPEEEEGNNDLDAANARISELEAALNEAQTTIQDLMAQVSSNAKPSNAKREFNPAKPANGKTAEDYKNAMREARKK